MQKTRYALIGALLIYTAGVFCLAGCGETMETAEVTSLMIEKNGIVTSNIVEDFGKDFYSIDTLKAMMQEEINSYNASHPAAMSLQTVELSEEIEGGVLVRLQYASCADYAEFNDEELFYGTPSEAQAAGYSLNAEFVDTDGNAANIGETEILAIKDAKILIIRQSAQVSKVFLPGKVLYMSTGTVLAGSKVVELPGPEEEGNIMWQGELTYVITK
ncbi:MAG: hypothetical protein J1E65_03605 [Lachnospiraceae bacterium]|nr:hypothetical protein [Lachnospiraceae bacterium]